MALVVVLRRFVARMLHDGAFLRSISPVSCSIAFSLTQRHSTQSTAFHPRWYADEMQKLRLLRKTDAVLALLDEAVASKVVNRIHFHIAMSALAKAGRADAAFELFTKMMKSEISPNTITFISLFNACANSDGPTATLVAKLREAVKEQRVTINVVGYNSLISAYTKHGEVEKALEVLDKEMPDMGVEPDATTFNTLISGLGKLGRLGDAFALYERMRKTGISPDEFTFNTLLDACANSSENSALVKVEEVRDTMKAEGMNLNAIGYHSLISAYTRHGDLDKAYSVFAKEMPRSGVKPGLVTFNTLIRAFGKAKRLGAAAAIYEKLRKSGLVPDVFTFIFMCDACSGSSDKARALEQVTEVIEDVKKRRVKIDVRVYNALIKTLVKHGEVEKAREVLEKEMSVRRVRPNTYTFNRIILAQVRRGRLEEAVELYEKMPQYGVCPNSFTFSAFFDGCALSSDKLALPLIAEIREEANRQEIKLDAPTYGALVRALEKHGAVAEVAVVRKEMADSGVLSPAKSNL